MMNYMEPRFKAKHNTLPYHNTSHEGEKYFNIAVNKAQVFLILINVYIDIYLTLCVSFLHQNDLENLHFKLVLWVILVYSIV